MAAWAAWATVRILGKVCGRFWRRFCCAAAGRPAGVAGGWPAGYDPGMSDTRTVGDIMVDMEMDEALEQYASDPTAYRPGRVFRPQSMDPASPWPWVLIGAAIGLEHRGITRFVENELGQLGVRQLACLRLPAAHLRDEAGKAAPRLRREFVGLGDP